MPCDLEIWRMTLENNRAPLLSNIKLYVPFHHHMWIQTGVTVQKRLSWVVTSVTLNFDLWHWPFAWTSLLSLVITPENFMMIRWGEHSQKGVTDISQYEQTHNMMQVWMGKLSELQLPVQNPARDGACTSMSYWDRQTDRQTDGQTDRQTDGLNHSKRCLVAAKNCWQYLILMKWCSHPWQKFKKTKGYCRHINGNFSWHKTIIWIPI